MKRLLWWLIAGTKGGVNRARILVLLHEKPCNAHQIAQSLGLDYKTIRHHLGVLEKNQIITPYGNKKYGAVYSFPPCSNANMIPSGRFGSNLGKSR